MIECIITVEKSTHYLEKSIEFVGYFCSLLKPTTDNNNEYVDHQLLKEILSHLLKVWYFPD